MAVRRCAVEASWGQLSTCLVAFMHGGRCAQLFTVLHGSGGRTADGRCLCRLSCHPDASTYHWDRQRAWCIAPIQQLNSLPGHAAFRRASRTRRRSHTMFTVLHNVSQLWCTSGFVCRRFEQGGRTRYEADSDRLHDRICITEGCD